MKWVNHTNSVLLFSDHQKADARLKVNDFELILLWKVETLSKKILVEEMKFVVTSKDEFEHGDKSHLIASFGTFVLQQFWTKEQNKLFFKEKSFAKLGISIETFMEKIERVLKKN